jgi:hypothetical protein
MDRFSGTSAKHLLPFGELSPAQLHLADCHLE